MVPAASFEHCRETMKIGSQVEILLAVGIFATGMGKNYDACKRS